ncbi:PepSY-associated TM helix domain-containing protein [Brevundimonas lutea]|uniref:PepSY-associated TM helix domain-containing protein n=1 Tax=Brevundimonas lutea TaxID=2293980 RepID=UPI000F024272|nr:PepSY-associated TM helix domain-containing protein [Brevundimonas lutea]
MRAARPAIRLWHRWFGLLAGVWLLLLAVTGSAITYYDELDRALNPDLRSAPAAGGPADPAAMSKALAATEAALPGFSPRHIDLPDRSRESIWLIGSAEVDGARTGVQAFADPSTGDLLGWRESGVWSLHRHHIPDLLYGLHVDLLVAPWVTWAFGLVSLFWLIDHGLALALAIPRLSLWADAFKLKGRAGSLRRLFDWHRAPGMWAWPVTAVLALTGVTLAWPDDSRDAVRWVTPVSERLDFTLPDRPVATPSVTVEQAFATVAPLDRIDSFRPLPDKGVYAVRTFDPRDLDYQGRLWTYVDMTTGAVVARRHDNGDGAGDAFFAWQYPLHSGQAFGEVGRALVFLGGVVTAGLAWTGVLLWWRRRRRSRPA